MNLSYNLSPIFLLGMQRSGTSLVRAFLSNHPQLAIPIRGETQFFAKYAKQIDNYNQNDIEKFHQQFMLDSKVKSWGIDWSNFEPPKLMEGERKSKQYFDHLMNYFTQQTGGERWGEKSTSHIKEIETILQLYPEAQYLMIVRDPRDSFCSTRYWKKGKKVSPKEYAHQWANTYAHAMGLLLRSGANYKVIRHESMVQQTRQIIEEVFTWLGVSFDETHLQPRNLNWEQNSSFGDQRWTEGSSQQHTEKLEIDPSTVGRWKEILTSKEIKQIEEFAYNMLLSFGYEPKTKKSILEQSKLQKITRKLKLHHN